MIQHKTKPPFNGDWEQHAIRTDGPEDWVIQDSLPEITAKISWRLKDSLLSARIFRLARSTLRELDDGEWQCWRYLGSGSYGAAAVFTETDDAANLLDEIVVKEHVVVGDRHVPTVHFNGDRGLYMAEEAQIHLGMSRYRSDNLIHLRNYNTIIPNLRVPGPDEQQYPGSIPSAFMRFYLEYAPYGTLQNLLVRYKAFNRYLPELFLWHLFNSVAKAILILEPEGRPWFVAHLDIKPENIFLGYETTKSRDPKLTGGLNGELVGYPSIKLGDLGMACRVMKDNPISMRTLRRVGTPYYYAPEIADTKEKESTRGQYGGDWTPPTNRLDDNLTPKANVWGVGKIMYDAFSLSAAHHFDAWKAEERLQYERCGQKPILDYATIPFRLDRLHRSSPYTEDLSDLIERCMHAEPSRRPTAKDLYEMTRAGMNACMQDSETTVPFSVRHRKLYYRGNEINDMTFAERNCGKTVEPDEYLELLHPANNDPEEPELNIYPDQMWEMETDQNQIAKTQRDYRERKKRMNRKLKFRRYIHRNPKRLELRNRPRSIGVLDPDVELTYEGTANDEWFIKESRKDYGPANKDRDSDSSSEGDDNNDSSSEDDDDNDKPEDGPVGHGADPLGNDKTAPGAACEDGPQNPLNNRSRPRNPPPHYAPYFHKKASERAWVYGSGRKCVEVWPPYLEKPTMLQANAKPNRKRAADFFNSSQKGWVAVPPLKKHREETKATVPELRNSSQAGSTSRESSSTQPSVASSGFGDELYRPSRQVWLEGLSGLSCKHNLGSHRLHSPRKRPRLSQVSESRMEVRALEIGANEADNWNLHDWEKR